jgi:hypothetical protein
MAAMVQWSLTEAQREMLSDLAMLIERGGSWRFLHGPVAAADQAHYPDPWDETRAGVARVIARTLWHAHAPFDATLEDVRRPGAQRSGLLRNTLLQLARIDDRGVRFALQHIGNDDVAGIAAHEVGRAFVGWLARDGHPFRAIPDDGLPAPAIGSLATVYLGLGVVAINAAFHSRAGGELDGNMAYYSATIDRAGGVDVDDLAFLLAVQAKVRDDVLPALDSLRPTQAAAVAMWRGVLEGHEDELRQRLGLDVAPDPSALDRPPAPRPVAIAAEFDEAVLAKRNHGQRVFRFAKARVRWHALLGMLLGLLGGLLGLARGLAAAGGPVFGTGVAMAIVFVAIVFGAGAGGWAIGRAFGGTRQVYRCAACESFLAATASVCPVCGGTVVGDIAAPRDRLDAEERLEAEDRRVTGHSPDEADRDAGAAGDPS